MERAVPSLPRLSSYVVSLRRSTRRWAVAESWGSDRPGKPRRWVPAGTLAELAGAAWEEDHPRSAVRLRALRAMLSDSLDAVANIGGALESLQWLPPVKVADGTLWLSWLAVQRRPPDDKMLPPLIYLSALMGEFSGRLRLCRVCDRPFVAGYSWQGTCQDCEQARTLARRPDVRRVLDRLRKRPEGHRLRQQALAALRTLPLPQWFASWDTRLGGSGRPPATARRGRIKR